MSELQIRKGEHSRQCRYCRSEMLHRSRRRGLFEKTVARLLLLRPYRCERCDARYLAFAASKSEALPR